MDAHTRKVYVPMTETGFYILLCLREPNHGYGIVQKVKELTDGEIVLAPGTMYGSLSKMEKDGIIQFVKEEKNRKHVFVSFIISSPSYCDTICQFCEIPASGLPIQDLLLHIISVFLLL